VGPHVVVFSSSPGADVDVAAWDAHAQRFFRTRLALAGSLDDAEPAILVTPLAATANAPVEPAAERRIAWRARRAEDLDLADAGEARAGGGGLAGLARRCPTVWLVERASDDDRLALRLAMVLASVHLGPILDARGPELFGVKTARAKLGL
jgi:hypothetical protein